MLIPNHPDDERLSALASRDSDATDDLTLTAHVSSCDRCTELIEELGVLRAALADLPEVAPSRPLRLLPPVEPAPVGASDRLGGWARRFFAPVLASGAALALVGTIGTAAPSLSGLTAGEAGGGAAEERATVLQEPAAESVPSAWSAGGAADAAPSEAAAAGAAPDTLAAESREAGEDLATPSLTEFGVTAEEESPSGDASTLGSDDADGASGDALAITTERSPWPMVLFAGVALMIGALLLRWILVPRAG